MSKGKDPWAKQADKQKTIKKKTGNSKPEIDKKKGIDRVRKSPLVDIDFDPFVDLPSRDEDGLNAGFYGTYGTGKTSCAIDFPGPIYIVDTEGGSAKIATKEKREKGIKTMNLLKDTPQMVKATGSIMMRNIRKELVINTDVLFARYGIAMSWVINKANEDPGDISTVILDDCGQLYKMGQEWRTDAYGFFEDPTKVEDLYLKRGLQTVGSKWDNATSWNVTIAKIMQPIRLLKAQHVNLILISKTKQKSKRVGDDTIEWEEPSWYYETPGLMDMVFHFKKGKPFTVTPLKVRKKGAFEQYGNIIPNKSLKGDRFSFGHKAIIDIIDGKS